MLTNDYLVLDGGLATELINIYGHLLIEGDPLWSARLISTHPGDIAKVHASYLLAGSDVIETATYQASIDGIMTHMNVTYDSAVDIMTEAVRICIKERDSYWNNSEIEKKQHSKPVVAGSIGPYGACLANHSEYTGDYVDSVSVQELMDWHRPRVATLLQAGVDILAFETIPAGKEGEAIVQLLREFPSCKAWITFSCKDGLHTCRGDDISSAAQKVIACENILGVGVNCTKPIYIESLVGKLSQSMADVKIKKAIVVYSDSGEQWSPGNKWTREDWKSIGDYIPAWMDSGANWIGGCCRITPDDISLIRSTMMKRLVPP